MSRCWSIAALIAMRLSHERTLPPRNERMLRYAEKNASCTASDGLVPVRNHARDEREEVVLVALDEVVEGVEAAVPRPLQQDQVATLDRIFDGLRRPGVLHDGRDPPGGDGEARRV